MFFLSASSHLRDQEKTARDWHLRESRNRGEGVLKEVECGDRCAKARNGSVSLNREPGLCSREVRMGINQPGTEGVRKAKL